MNRKGSKKKNAKERGFVCNNNNVYTCVQKFVFALFVRNVSEPFLNDL